MTEDAVIPPDLLEDGKLVIIKLKSVAVAMLSPEEDRRGGCWRKKHGAPGPGYHCVLCDGGRDKPYTSGWQNDDNPDWFVCEHCFVWQSQ